jgi:hypothetical protein
MGAHKRVNKLLVGFVLKELSQGQISEVKSHVAVCQQCEDELKRLEELIKCTEKMSRLSADERVCGLARDKIFAAVCNEGNPKTNTRPNIGRFFRWRLFMRSPIIKLAAAAVVIAAVLIGVSLIGMDGTSSVWANVSQYILNAQTAIFTAQVGQIPIKMIAGEKRLREILPGGIETIIDYEAGRMLVLDSNSKTAMFMQMSGLPDAPPNFFDRTKTGVEKLKSSPDVVVESLGQRQIDGIDAQGLRAYIPGGTDMRVWSDQATNRPVLIEIDKVLGETGLVISDIQWDPSIDPNQFSMEVPQGYTLKQIPIQMDLGNTTEDDLIEALRIWSLVPGRRFPPRLDIGDWPKQAPMISRGLARQGLSVDQQKQAAMKVVRGLMFVRRIKGTWQYHGNGVQWGDAGTPIFWYLPKDSQTYRVIYGDLHTEDSTNAPAVPVTDPCDASTNPPGILGIQKDEWHLTADERVVAHCRVEISTWPIHQDRMSIELPYTKAVLESATGDGQLVHFRDLGQGSYELEIPVSPKVLECVWSMPLSGLEPAEYGYRAELQCLVLATCYSLTIVLDQGCPLELSGDTSDRRLLVFYDDEETQFYFGSCGIPVRRTGQ